MKTRKLPAWVPADLANSVRVLERIPERIPGAMKVYKLLTSDDRMESVWNWHQKACGEGGSSLAFCVTVSSATRMPTMKPANLPPGRRDDYLAAVRGHANALLELLADTIYDGARGTFFSKGVSGRWNKDGYIDPELLHEQVADDLHLRAQSNEPSVLAYKVSAKGVWYLGPPHFYLVEQLSSLVKWTNKKDRWNGPGPTSVGLLQPNRADARVGYFTRTVHSSLARRGIKIPFKHLATVGSVVLGVELDVGTVQKQVRRLQQTLGAKRPAKRTQL